MKIKTKIILFYSAIAVILFASVNLIVGFNVYNVLRNQAFDHLETISYLRSGTVHSYFQSKKEFAINLSASSVFRDFLKTSTDSADYQIQKKKTNERLLRTKNAYLDTDIHEIFIINTKGQIVASTDNKQIGQNKTNDPLFINGRNKIFFEDIYISPVTNKLALSISIPINDDQTHQLLGVLVTRLNPDMLYKMITDRKGLGTTGETFLINKNKLFISPSLFLGQGVILNKKVLTVNADECFNKEEIDEATRNLNTNINSYQHVGHQDIVKFYTDYRGVPIIGTHLYLPETDGCLITKIDQSEIFSPLKNILYITAIATIIGILFFIFIGIWISRFITSPIEILNSGIELIEKGNLDYRIDIKSKDEIGHLSRSFNHMVEAIKNSRIEIDRQVSEQTEKIKKQQLDLEDKQKALLNVLEDVEEEKTKAQSVARDLEKYKLAVKNASDHIVITDSEGLILFANNAVVKITGYSIDEVIGKKAGNKDLWGGLMDSEFYQKLWQTIKTDKKVFSGEINNKRKNGEKYVALASIAPVIDNNNQVLFFVGIERDITKAKEVDRMKTEFISLASHQLRTPLSAMKWYLEMLLSGDAGKMSDEQTEYVKNVDASNERMIDLVNSLLNISRIESGRIIINPKPTNLGQLVKDVIKELEVKFKEKNISVITSFYDNIPDINIDSALIRNVYMNLLTNAIKYTKKDGEISVIISKKDQEIISQITDNGYGIPVSQQEKVFSKFFRAENIIKLETEGSGLGLYLVKAIVDSSGGKIWFKSQQDQGTTFWLSLPLTGSKPKTGEVTLDS